MRIGITCNVMDSIISERDMVGLTLDANSDRNIVRTGCRIIPQFKPIYNYITLIFYQKKTNIIIRNSQVGSVDNRRFIKIIFKGDDAICGRRT